MDYTDLKRRLADRAKSERAIQANNQAVATALRGQRLLFEQGARSEAISYAMRLCLEHENCAKHDAALAADWAEAAAAIAALEAEVAGWRLRVERIQAELIARGADSAGDEASAYNDAALALRVLLDSAALPLDGAE